MIRWVLVALAGVAIVVMLAGVALGISSGDASDSDEGLVLGGPSRYLGVRQLPPYDIPPVALTATDGSAYDLRASAEGKLLLLYVGYTNCADACPLHMVEIASALEQLPPELAEQVLVVFVTADPDRDTPEIIETWLANFSTDFVGLTGDQAELNNIQRALGLNPASHTTNDHGGYDVDHGTTVFAFPPESRKAELVYPVGTTAADYAADIEKLLEDGKVRQ
jgi:protein SCO1/2